MCVRVYICIYANIQMLITFKHSLKTQKWQGCFLNYYFIIILGWVLQ